MNGARALTLRWLSGGAVVWALVGSSVFAFDNTGHITPRNGSHIQGLTWKSDTAEVRTESGEQGPKVIGVLSGHFSESEAGWTLVAGKADVVSTTADKLALDFDAQVPLTGETTSVEFTAVGPAGQLERETVDVSVPGYQEIKAYAEAHPSTPLNLTVGLQVGSIALDDTRQGNSSELGVTARVGYLRPLNDKWDVHANVAYTALPMGSGITARYLDMNLRVGYLLAQGSWNLKAMIGAFYTTTASASNPLVGYSNVVGPELFPVLQKDLADGKAVEFYAKFSPISGNSVFLPLGSHDAAVGGAYAFHLANKHVVTGSVDISSTRVNLDNQDVSRTAVMAGVSYQF